MGSELPISFTICNVPDSTWSEIISGNRNGLAVGEVCRQNSISESTFYKWKAKYGGMETADIRRLKELESENSKLKRMYADLSLECHALKDLIEKKL